MKYFRYFVFVLFVFLLAGCGKEPEPTPVTKQQTTVTPPLNITYCDIDPSDLCLEGFDLNDDGQTLIYFLADDYSFADIYVQAELGDEEVAFVCVQSQNTPENVYCLGDSLSDDTTSITLKVYANTSREQIARGVFVLEYLALPAPDVDFEAITLDATQTVVPTITQVATQTAIQDVIQAPTKTAIPVVTQAATNTSEPITVQTATGVPAATGTPLPDYPNPTLDAYPNPTSAP